MKLLLFRSWHSRPASCWRALLIQEADFTERYGQAVHRGHDFLPSVAMIWKRGLATGF